MMAE
jgi:hypothetical protein